ncbi:Kinase suppressor of Ras 2 [Dirofilaria immitis]|nr:Kinase suppressor of Ras 2 [Dirofilaria immitis]
MPNSALQVGHTDWSQKVDQSLHAIDIIGRKLVIGRSTCKNPGSELILIQLEAKLIRHASQICYINQRYRGTKYPSLNEWLTYVNLLPTEIVAVLECLQTFYVLITVNDKSFWILPRGFDSHWMAVVGCADEGYEPIRSFSDRDLCWMSFDHSTSSDSRTFAYENTAESSASDSGSGVGSNLSQSSLPTTTPPASPNVTVINATLCSTLNVFPRSVSEKASVPNRLSTTSLITDGLMRSHSHESNLQYTVNSSRGSGLTSSRSINDCLSVVNRGAMLNPLSSHLSYTGQVANTMPRTPKTARAKHSIPHQWHRRKGFRISTENCHFCQRQLNFSANMRNVNLASKWKVHPHCKEKIGDSCGLTPAYLKQALKEMFMKDPGNDGWTPSEYTSPSQQVFPFDPADSSSSTNSSAPSTPAFAAVYSTTLPTSGPFLLPSAPPSSYRCNFDFPEAVPELPDIVVESSGSEQQRLISSQGSDCTVNSSGTIVLGASEGSEGTLCIDSVGSSGSNFDNREELDIKLSPNSACSLNRDRWSNGTIRVPNSWNDFTIPFSQIEFKKQSLVGKGRFGRANWYGDVAVKLLNMDHVDEEKQLEAFKLGIVMHYCKGRPLHQLLHDHHEKFDCTEIVYFATQICQIIHKDLRTKNIFVESRNRIVITDFGLFNMKRLGQPQSCSTILAVLYCSELIKALSAELVQLPFTENSDVYAFGTIWYELMTYRFPFQELHPDVVIWKVGSGFKTPLSDISGPREVKDILIQCWNYIAKERPTLRDISEMLERFPKNALHAALHFLFRGAMNLFLKLMSVR